MNLIRLAAAVRLVRCSETCYGEGMRKILGTLIVAALFVTTASCQGGQPEDTVNLDVLRELPIVERIPELVRLENERPRDPMVKLELGLAYGSAGQYAISQEYFQAALEDAGRDAQLEARAALGLANAHLGQGEFEQAAQIAAEYQTRTGDQALQLVQARALFLNGEVDGARELYGSVWDQIPEQLIATDYLQYAEALIGNEQLEQARTVLSNALGRFGYAPGIGFRLSTVSETAGDSSASVLYAFLDSLHAVEAGNLARDRLVQNLRAIDSQLPSGAESRSVIGFAVATTEESWAQAEALAAQLDFPPGTEVLRSIAALSGDPGSEELREQLLRLFDRFGNYAPLYRALIRSFRVDLDYRFSTARSVLERAIALTPDGPLGQTARVEIGRLLDLSAGDVPDVRTDQELLVRAQAAAAGSALDPTLGDILRSLELPEHPYTATAVSLIRDLVRLDRAREYVRTWIEEAPPRARARVEPLM